MDYIYFNDMQLTPYLAGPLLDVDPTERPMQGRTPIDTPLEHPRSYEHVTPVSVSTTFHPNALIEDTPPDIVLLSSDKVHFYVHCYRVLSASENQFNSLLPPSSRPESRGHLPVVRMPEPADVLNIVVHTAYSMTAHQFAPSFEIITVALDALAKYGMPPKSYATSLMPLYFPVYSHAPHRPIDSYALAGTHDLEDLAVAISPHLLPYPLPCLTDELAARIGPVYLKRLFFLHDGRMEALKSLLLHPPLPHVETEYCNEEQQQKLTRAWALASAQLAWDARPDLSANLLQAALLPLEKELSCELCKWSLRNRITNLIKEWAAVKPTI